MSSQERKFETGFSGSHLTAEELREKIYHDLFVLKKQLPSHPMKKFRYSLEVHEI